MAMITFAMASSEWGVARFTTDSIALIALAILIGMPWFLLRERLGARSPWAQGNAFASRDD